MRTISITYWILLLTLLETSCSEILGVDDYEFGIKGTDAGAQCSEDADCKSPTESCIDGVCREPTSPGCRESSDCTQPGPCEMLKGAQCSLGQCIYQSTDIDQPCDDDNPCTSNDRCDGDGQCIGVEMICNDDHGGCLSSDGICDSSKDPPECDYGGADRESNGTPCVLNGGTDTQPGVCVDGTCVECIEDEDCVFTDGDPVCFDAECNEYTCTYTRKAASFECLARSCQDGILYSKRVCGEEGLCPDTGSTSCLGFSCQDSTSCSITCAASIGCLEGYFCNHTEDEDACLPKRSNGEECEDFGNRACTTGHCQNGFCCEAGDCCASVKDCSSKYGEPDQCDDPKTCQGHRTEPECANHTCVATEIADDALCEGEVADSCGNFVDVLCNGDTEQEALSCLEDCDGDDNNCDFGFLCVSGACTKATFEGLGDLPSGDTASYVEDVSYSGDVAVGWSRTDEGDAAFRWTPSEGLYSLGGNASQAHGVSPDGNLIVGSVAEASHEGGRAAVIWRGDEPFEILLDAVLGDGNPTLWIVDGTVVLDDGRVYATCIQYGAYGDPIGCRYDGPGDLHTGLGCSHIYAADDQGNYAGDSVPSVTANGDIEAIYNGEELDLPEAAACISPGACSAEARAFALDPTVIVGNAIYPVQVPGDDYVSAISAFLNTESEGTTALPDLEDGEDICGAFAIDAQGRIIGGYGTGPDGKAAVLWIDGFPTLLEDVLVEAGGALPNGWKLLEVRAMSLDGLIIVGNGENPQGYPEAFRIVLPKSLLG